jgi:hypothetical protein
MLGLMHDRAAWRRNFGSLVPLLSIAALADTAAGAFADATGTAIATGLHLLSLRLPMKLLV